jgi:hypothetical protein
MDRNEYELPAAAAILGVDPEKLSQMIQRGEVEARDENGIKWISKATIAKLFDRVSNDQDDPEKAKVLEKVKKPKLVKKTRLPKGAITLEPEPILADDPKAQEKEVINNAKKQMSALYEERNKLHTRIGSMIEHIQKLNYRIEHMRKAEEGKLSEFWLLAGSVFKQINHKSNMGVAEYNGNLIICPADSDCIESGNDKIAKLINAIKNTIMPSQIKDGMIQAIKDGKMPPDKIIRDLGLNPEDYHEGGSSSEEGEDE